MSNRYQTYEPIDFAQDDSFIRWVKGMEDADQNFWEAWQAAHPEKAADLAGARRLVLAMQVQEEPVESKRIDQLWNRIDQATAVECTVSVQRLRLRRIIGYAAAAAITLLVVFLLFNPVEKIDSGGQQLTYVFPDGSSVNLNADARVRFNEMTWEKTRTVRLEGEGFFSVIKGSPFSVITPQGTIEVLGTSFNVQADAEGFSVICMTGRVAVKHQENTRTLSARQATRLGDDGALSQPTTVDKQAIADWRQGEYTLRSAPLRQVLDEMERQFGIVIPKTPADDTQILDYTFKNNDLETAVKGLGYISERAYEIRGDTVIFLAK